MQTRQQLRVPLSSPVKVKVSDKDDDFQLTVIEDLSWGGAFVLLDSLPGLGDRIIIQFLLADENASLELWGSVVRVRKPAGTVKGGVGIMFDTLDDETRSFIQRLISEEIKGLLKTL